MSIETLEKIAKIFYALVLWAIAICILLIQLFIVKTFLPSLSKDSVMEPFFYGISLFIFLFLTVFITDFLRRKIPRFYLLFVLLAFIGLLLVTVYITN